MDNRPWSRGPYRVEMTCRVTFDGPLHVGSGERLDASTDAPILRRPGTDDAVLPGASIRGVVRDWCEREAPLLGVSQDHLRSLFGYSGKKPSDDDRQGRLTVFDVVLQNAARNVRDHVRIDPAWGAAAAGGKFDQGVAETAEETVELRFLYEGTGENDPELTLLRAAARALEEGVLFLGGKTGWGLGMVRNATVSWNATDRGDTNTLSEFLIARITESETLPAKDLSWTLKDPYAMSRSSGQVSQDHLPWSWLRLELDLQFDGPMLTAGPYNGSDTNSAADRVDATYFTDRAGTAVWPGSSIRGVIASQARRIAETLDIPDISRALFGYVDEKKPDKDIDKARRGLLHVGEGRLVGANGEPEENVKTVLLNHVAIDRVTGFAADAKLFSTLALASPRFRTRWVVRWHAGNKLHEAAVALLLFVLRDMQQKLVWAGSRTTRGYGRLVGAKIASARLSQVHHGTLKRGFDTVAGLDALKNVAMKLDGPTAAWKELIEKVA